MFNFCDTNLRRFCLFMEMNVNDIERKFKEIRTNNGMLDDPLI